MEEQAWEWHLTSLTRCPGVLEMAQVHLTLAGVLVRPVGTGDGAAAGCHLVVTARCGR